MKHPINGAEIHRQTYESLCSRIRRFYGVEDAEGYFASKRKEILDKCTTDVFGWGKYESLKNWHDAKVLAARFAPSNQE